MTRLWRTAGLAVTLPTLLVACTAGDALAQDDPDPTRFEKNILEFEAEDRMTPPPEGAVLFVGSSSIRYWDLDTAFPGLTLIQRSFGGSHISDHLYYADRVILRYAPRLIVFYAGDADTNAGKSSERIFEDFKALVDRVHEKLPDTRIVVIAIKPSPAHWDHVDISRTANAMIRDLAGADPLVTYADVETPMLGADGTPKPDIFAENGLNLNAKGYEIWTSVVRPLVEGR